MKIKVSRKAWLSIGATVALLVLIWVAGTALAQEPDGDSPSAPLGGGGPNETQAFTYQGRLEDGGQPANGVYDFQVDLYDDPIPGKGSWLASCTDVRNMSLQDQYVEDGIFHFYLVCGNWNGDFFTGGMRWLRIQAKRDDQLTYTDLTTTRRQPISPAPYAWSLYPRAIISSLTSVGGNFGNSLLNLQDTRPSDDPSGSSTLLVRNHTGTAIRTEAGTTGVYGYGLTGPGIVGKSGGTAGFFTSGNGYGVYAESSGADPWDHGGFFSATHGCGVYAKSASKEGVFGYSVYSDAVHGFSSNGHGVYGGSYSPSHYGGFFVNTGGGYLLAANNENTTTELEFKVDNDGDVYADGGFHCGRNFDCGGDNCTESELEPCLYDLQGADFAEVLPAAESAEPGDALVIGLDGQLVVSSEPYQASVAGVYSAQPSYVGGAANLGEDGYAPLAIVGLVPVKVSAENGPIAPGDLLVTSSTPGHVMKADPDPSVGTVIGKAMEPLDEGTGLIQMLVMLQ
jgi:hypothetical protein